VAAAAGGLTHVVVLAASGAVTSSGYNNDFKQIDVPVSASNPGSATAVAAGARHSLALLAAGNGTVVAWGDNRAGQLAVPAAVSGPPGGGVRAVSARGNWSMALLGAAPWVMAWGEAGPGNVTRQAACCACCGGAQETGVHWGACRLAIVARSTGARQLPCRLAFPGQPLAHVLVHGIPAFVNGGDAHKKIPDIRDDALR
jgi:hypothetical protein